MANSYVTNLYPKPTTGVTDRRVTVGASAANLVVADLNALTRYAVLDIQGGDIFVTFDGSTPTTSNGHKLYNTRSYTWSAQAAKAAKVIRSGASDVTVHFSEFTD